MLPPLGRLLQARELVEQQAYFVVHAPRQAGKTTSIRTLAEELNASGRYAALLTSCEVGQSLESDLEGSIAAILDILRQDAEESLPAELRPPAPDDSKPPRSRLRDLLVRWSRSCDLPVVLLLDEIDALFDDALISVLRQLRSGYDHRPDGFPQSVVLVGLRDVRDYRLEAADDSDRLGTSSPFNIKVESLRLRNFTRDEIAELYAQHESDTGQAFTDDAVERAWELTAGQPWLVNSLARQAVEELVADRDRPIEASVIETAKERLILRRDSHLDSLVERLREPRVRRVIEPILAGTLLSPEVLDDDVQLAQDLGLVASGDGSLRIANPIYREVIPRALTHVLEHSLPADETPPTDEPLDVDGLLEGFRRFWLEHGEILAKSAPYAEVAAQLVFMAYLQKLVNGGGFIDREYAVGRGRIDLCVRWPRPEGVERWAIELKAWRDGRPDPLPAGLDQLRAYLLRLSLDEGTLIVFDQRSDPAPAAERWSDETVEHEGARIRVLRA